MPITRTEFDAFMKSIKSMSPEARKAFQAENLRKLQAGEFEGGLLGGLAGGIADWKRQQKIKKMQLTASKAATAQRRRLRGLGRTSTLLTGGRGVLGEAPVVRKSLLGQ